MPETKQTSGGIKYLTNNSAQTKKLGRTLAKKFLKAKSKKAVVIGLVGELGSGKTTFLQGLAKGLGIKEKVLSPTFIILKKFKIQSSQFKNFYHIDCYRIEKTKELLSLGFKDIISSPGNIVAVEWAEKIKKILPENRVLINFKQIDKNTRKLIIKEKDLQRSLVP